MEGAGSSWFRHKVRCCRTLLKKATWGCRTAQPVCALQRAGGGCSLHCATVPSERHLEDPQDFLQMARGSSLY